LAFCEIEVTVNLARPNEFDDEAAVVTALKASDPQAFETIVRRFGGRMHAVARRYLRSEQDCADAIQESFVSAFQAIDRFQQDSQLGTWLHRIVVNVCLMKLRSQSRHQEFSIEELLPGFDGWGHHRDTVRKWKNAPEARLDSEETKTLVRHCIDQLPDDYRTVLLLRDIEEYTTEETAELLKTTPGAVKTRLHRARQALRTLLEPHFAE
jgi:RNA polymerase sigma-70 factor (ECF subfamily)